MADTPIRTPSCAFCDWTGEPISQPAAHVVRQLEQEAVLAHHFSAHGFPHQQGERADWLVYFPDRESVVTLNHDFAGIALVDDGMVRLLEDERPDTLDGLNHIQRAVLVARLTAWADQLGDVAEVHTVGGERIQCDQRGCSWWVETGIPAANRSEYHRHLRQAHP